MKSCFLKKILPVILIFYSSGCIWNTRENFDRLTDRKFYFSEFQFILLDQKKEDAFIFFKHFPVKKIMYMLAMEYNVTIDISDFKNFIDSDTPSFLLSDGFFRNEKSTWKLNNSNSNRIVFIFEQDYFDSSKQKFKISFYDGDALLKTITAEISKVDYIFTQLNFQLKMGKESIKEYDEKKYDTSSPIPSVVEINSKSGKNDESADIMTIKKMIDEYIKTLDKNGREDFKHQIIDYIYEKCK